MRAHHNLRYQTGAIVNLGEWDRVSEWVEWVSGQRTCGLSRSISWSGVRDGQIGKRDCSSIKKVNWDQVQSSIKIIGHWG